MARDAITFRGTVFNGILAIFALVGVTAAEPSSDVLALDREHSVLAAYAGEPIVISLKVSPELKDPGSKVTAEVVNHEGDVVELCDLSVAAGSAATTQSLVLTPKAQPVGYYDVALTLWQGADRVQDLYTSFSVLAPAGEPTDDSRFGVYTNSDVGIFTSIVPLGFADVLKKSGARWGTFTTYWFLVQPDRETWDWAALDHRFEVLKQANIQPIPTLFGVAEWASSYEPHMPKGGDGLTFQVYPPKDLKAWGEYVYRFVDRYKDQLKYVRVWNEFDNDYFMGKPSDFAEMLKVAYQEAHRAKPGIQVIIDTSYAKMYYFESLWRSGAADSFDIIAIHNYHQLDKVLPPELTMFRNEYEATSAWRDKRVPGRPIIDDEFGIFSERTWISPAWLGQGSLAQANQMVRAHLIALSAGVSRLIWFPAASYNVTVDDKVFTENAGFLHPDLSPQPAYSAYQTMATTLRDAEFVRAIAMPSPTQFAYVFRTGGQVVTVLWNIAEQPEWASFTTGEASLELRSMMGEREPLVPQQGYFSLQLTRSPQYVVGAGELELDGRRLRLPSGEYVVEIGGNPGDLERPVTVEATNRSSRGRILFVDAAEGRAADGFPMQLSLTKGQTVKMDGKLLAPAANDSGKLPVTFKILEKDGYDDVFPVAAQVAASAAPLWQATTAEGPAQYEQDFPEARDVDALLLTLPQDSAYHYKVEARVDGAAAGDGWMTVRAPGLGSGTERIPVGARINAVRVSFEQLMTAAGFEDEASLRKLKRKAKDKPAEFSDEGGWRTKQEQVAITSDEAHTGRQSVRIRADERVDGWMNSDQFIKVKDNTYYSFTVYAKIPENAQYHGYAGISAVNADSGQLMSFVNLTHVDGAWHKYFVTVRTDPGQRHLRLSCSVSGQGEALYDDVMGIEGTQPTDIARILSLDVIETRH